MMIRLAAADGHEFGCWTQPAEGTRRGGLVILQEIFGVTEQLKGVGARYAALGYEIAIPAFFDRKERDAVIPFADPPRGRALMQSLDQAQVMLDMNAAVAAQAAKGGKVAVLGFCWGGGQTVPAAQSLDIAAAIGFYPTQVPKYLGPPLKAPVQFHCGKTDDHTSPEVLATIRAALPEIEMHIYEAGHAFANDARPQVYDAEAAALAHERSAAFLAKHMG